MSFSCLFVQFWVFRYTLGVLRNCWQRKGRMRRSTTASLNEFTWGKDKEQTWKRIRALVCWRREWTAWKKVKRPIIQSAEKSVEGSSGWKKKQKLKEIHTRAGTRQNKRWNAFDRYASGKVIQSMREMSSLWTDLFETRDAAMRYMAASLVDFLEFIRWNCSKEWP